jgi:hypothetical protein
MSYFNIAFQQANAHVTFAFFAGGSSDNAKFFLIMGVFVLVGLVVFILGFRTYREYRILEDTPLAPIRSIPMGLVHIFGKTVGENRLSSPLTHTPCYYYKVHVEKWVKKDKNREGWETVRTDSEKNPFYMDDATGKVQVDPNHAEFDVPKTFQAEIGSWPRKKPFVDPTLGVAGPGEDELRAYLSTPSGAIAQALASLPVPGAKALGKVLEVEQTLESLGVAVSAGGISLGGAGGQRFRFTEHCLIAERECNIIGTCVENADPKDEHDRNLIKKGQNEPTFLISSRSEKELEKSVRRKAFLMIFVGALMMIGFTAAILGKLGLFK